MGSHPLPRTNMPLTYIVHTPRDDVSCRNMLQDVHGGQGASVNDFPDQLEVVLLMKASAMEQDILAKGFTVTKVSEDSLDLQIQEMIEDPRNFVQAFPITGQAFECHTLIAASAEGFINFPERLGH